MNSCENFFKYSSEDDLKLEWKNAIRAHPQPLTSLDCQGGRILTGSHVSLNLFFNELKIIREIHTECSCLKIEFWNAALQTCPNFSQKYTCLRAIKKCWNVSSRLLHFFAFVLMYLFVKYIPRHSGYKYEPISTLSIHRSYLNEGHNAIVTHFKSSLRLL